jgi:hypothetical protein
MLFLICRGIDAVRVRREKCAFSDGAKLLHRSAGVNTSFVVFLMFFRGIFPLKIGRI